MVLTLNLILLNNKKGEKKFSPIKTYLFWSIFFFILAIICHLIKLSNDFNLIGLAAAWFFFALSFGLFVGYGLVHFLGIEGPYSKFSKGDLIIRFTMGVTFFVVFMGGLIFYAKFNG